MWLQPFISEEGNFPVECPFHRVFGKPISFNHIQEQLRLLINFWASSGYKKAFVNWCSVIFRQTSGFPHGKKMSFFIVNSLVKSNTITALEPCHSIVTRPTCSALSSFIEVLTLWLYIVTIVYSSFAGFIKLCYKNMKILIWENRNDIKCENTFYLKIVR